ncbi:MAG: hypothetical protein K2K10_04375, partial [Acetatifactor sp.]|nr:hypothetical protein [Acetatifactor sp.]
FQDAPSQPHNESCPIWYLAVGQCFMRAGDYVSQDMKDRSKEFFLLLRRLLDMGMDPNQKATSDFWSRNAWQYALDQYDYFARSSYTSYNTEGDKSHNRQLREMLKAVLDELLAHGVDIHDYELTEEHSATTSLLIRNLEEGRELFDGFYGLDPEKLKPSIIKYHGKEFISQPTPVEEQRQRYEIKWRELEPVLRSYYEKI